MLQASKMSKLKEMVGEVKREEEPEGKVVAGPGGEAIVYRSGNIPLFLSLSLSLSLFFFQQIINYSILHLTMAYLKPLRKTRA